MRNCYRAFAAVAALTGSAFAGITSYGVGCPDGSGGTPSLTLTGQSFPGGLLTIDINSGVASGSALLFLGLGQAAAPMGFGCFLNVAPLLPGPLGPLPLDANGNLAFSTILPPSLPAPFTVTLQAFAIDPSVPLGFGNSNGVQLDVTVAAPTPNGLVINEVDYDEPGTDFNEFVEIHNPTANAISLAGIRLVLVNGANNATYLSLDLSSAGAVPAGGYLVVANASVIPDPGALVINFTTASNSIQNGAPDGIALIDATNGLVLDALSYEGSMTAATVTGIAGTVNLVEGNATTIVDTGVVGSLIRFPTGYDSNDAASDWLFSATSTPGAANVP
jgi:hypothetical protein